MTTSHPDDPIVVRRGDLNQLLWFISELDKSNTGDAPIAALVRLTDDVGWLDALDRLDELADHCFWLPR